MEIRIKDVDLQCSDGILKIGGYINVTERESEMLYNKKKHKWFKEIMKRGVFQSAIDKAMEIPLLLEHNWNKKIATTANNTLELREDQIGLRFDAVIDDENIYAQVKSGVINSCSFGFRALEEDIEEINNRLEKRYVRGIELLEVSLVKNPAYIGSLVESRAYEEEMKNATPEVQPEEVVEEGNEVKPEEVEERVEEPVEVEATEVPTEEEVKTEPENTEDRNIGFEEIQPQEETKEITEDIAEQVEEVIDDLIEQKEMALNYVESEEKACKEYLEEVKEEHEMVEQGIKNTVAGLSTEIIKLRLELIKLKHIKDGI